MKKYQKTKEVCLYEGSNYQGKRLKIPETYKGKPVVKIGGGAFNNCVNLEEVVIPNTVMEIRGVAFKGCVNLKEINIPSIVNEIGKYAFYECEKLREEIKEELINKWGCVLDES